MNTFNDNSTESPEDIANSVIITGNLSKSGILESNASTAITSLEVWGWALLFVTVINLSSIMGILFFPLMKKSFYTTVMRTMIGLAIGSLSGSALFHLIPAAFDLPTNNKEGIRYINIASFIWLAAWIVMIVECVIKIVVKTKAFHHNKKITAANEAVELENNNPSHYSVRTGDNSEIANGDLLVTSNGPTPTILINLIADNDEGTEGNAPLKSSHHDMPIYHSTFSLNKRAQEAMKDNEDYMNSPKPIKTVAWIVIIGDSIHNFIDGISIGAGFVKSFNTGAVLALAVICEEFPHELGDFAILINSGLSVKKALCFNFMSALTCYLGMAIGILLGEIEWANYIFAFAAGIFLYVALGDMVPEVTSLIDEVSEIAPHKAWKVLVNHNIGIFVGITILYLLALYHPD